MNSYDSNSILLSPEVDISYPWTCSFPLSLDGTSLPGEDVTTAPYSYKNMLDLTAKLPQNAAGFYFPVSVARSPTTSSNFDVSACVSPALSGPDSGESDGHAQATTSKTPERRRAQNRAAQRAFRKRKERRERDLEAQVAELLRDQASLSCSYEQQKEEVNQLQGQLKLRNAVIAALRSRISNYLLHQGAIDVAFGHSSV